MDTKKATHLTIIVTVIAVIAMTITIAWLSTGLPNTGNIGYVYENDNTPEVYPLAQDETPDEPYDDITLADETDPATPDYILDDNIDYTTPGYEGVDPPFYEYDDEEYPYDYNGGYDYVFTPIFTSEPLPEHIIQLITGVTFHDTTPFGFDYLTYLTVTHVNFYGESVLGHLIVAADIGYEVLDIFREIYEGGFPIHSIKLIDYFDASDYLSMAANNSHAFNFRYIAGTNVISRHGFGVAIDINPIQNPYIRGETIWPAAGAEYVDRSYVRPGMIVPGDVVYNAFISRGWIWGGYWTRPRDYHHFERRR